MIKLNTEPKQINIYTYCQLTFDEVSKNVFWEEFRIFNKWGQEICILVK